jgi:ATP-dependent Clp protease ATP-binding subunit ClpB
VGAYTILYAMFTQICFVGSDILAHSTACDINGLVTPEAREEVLERVSEHLPPELLNRLDSMQVFNKLSRQSILEVVSLRLKDVADRLKSRRITLDVDNEARNWLAEQGYSHVYGARAIARVVRTDVLFPLAQKLLRGTIRWVFLVCLSLDLLGVLLMPHGFLIF